MQTVARIRMPENGVFVCRVPASMTLMPGDACMVVISENGKVDGEVHAAHLVVSGAVNGPLHVSQLLELQPKARITGDVHYHGLEIHHGAVVEGRLIYSAGDTRPALKLAAGGTTSET